MKDQPQDVLALASADEEAGLLLAIGRQIRKVRKNQGLTVTELSRASWISQAMISKIENGRTSASLGTLQRIANGLGVQLSSLLIQLRNTTTAAM